VKTAKRLSEDGCLILHGTRPNVAKVFELLGLLDRTDSLHLLDGHGSS